MKKSKSYEKNVRQSNFELLRILCITVIIMHHWGIHGEAINSEHALNRWISMVLAGGGQIGVSIFFLISGYFYQNISFNSRKILKVVFPAWIYCDVIGILYFFIFGAGIEWLLPQLFPVINRAYNFLINYIMILILSPFLKKLIETLTEKQLDALLFQGVIWLSVIPTITGNNFMTTLYPIFLFLLGARLKNEKEERSVRKYTLCALASYSLIFVILFIVGSLNFDTQMMYKRLINFESLLVLSCSISLFLLFKKIKIASNKFINAIAGCVWGIFLIHDHGIIRYVFWRDLFNVSEISNSQSWLLVLNCFLSVTIVFILCLFIELIRKKICAEIYEKVIVNNYFLNNLFDVIDKYIDIKKIDERE